MENSVIQHTFLKFDQYQKNPDFQENPQIIKQKNPRSREKNSSGITHTVLNRK